MDARCTIAACTLSLMLALVLPLVTPRAAKAGAGGIEFPLGGLFGRMSLQFHFRFEPTDEEVEDVKGALGDAARELCDATDREILLTDVRLTSGRNFEEEAADIWYLPQDGRSFVNFLSNGRSLGTLGRHVLLYHDDLQGDIIAHELGHHAFGLGDEYDEQCRFGGGCGIGPCFDDGTDERNNCMMQQNGNELCVAQNHDERQGESGGDDGSCGMPACADEPCTIAACSARWNSDTDRFEVTQQELIHPGRSCWETLVQNYPLVSPPSGLPTGTAPSTCGTITYEEALDGPDQVLLVMDRSGSMGTAIEPGSEQSRLDYGKAAARAFVDFLSERNASVGLFSFATLPKRESRLAPLDEDAVEQFKAVVDDLDAFGRTSMGLALKSATIEFSDLASQGRSRIAVLLSDGRDNPILAPGLGVDPLDAADELKEQNARIITVPLGLGADRRTMAELAARTDGLMIDAPVGDELPAIFTEIAARVMGEAVLLPRTASAVSGVIPDSAIGEQQTSSAAAWLRNAVARLVDAALGGWMPGVQAQSVPASEEFPFTVEVGAERLNVVISARNLDVDTWNPGFRLRGPAGEVIDDDDPGIVRDPYYRIVSVIGPSAGTWTLEIFARGTDLQRSFLLAHAENPLPDCLVAITPQNVPDGDTARISAETSFVADLEGVSFEGTVTRPDGSVVALTFSRDPLTRANGADFDDFAGRGNYEVAVRCVAGAGARVMPGEPIFPGPDADIETTPFERVARTAFFYDGATLPPCTVADCDGDGIPNAMEGSDDIDGDGLPCDRDDDCDGDDLGDADEGTGDSDGDGTPDVRDADADDDCMPDGADPNPTTPDAPICGDAILCDSEQCDDINDLACPGRCAPAGAPDECTCRPIDDYKCYKTRQVGERFMRRDVPLEDQFGSTTATVERPRRLCNPVDTEGEGVADPTAHLMCYTIDEPAPPPHDVLVTDRFGEHRLTVRRADSLCLPAEKDGVSSPLTIDHFKCYAVRPAKRAPRFTTAEVELSDQFEDKTTVAIRPRFLCNPVDKNGEGIRHPDNHLACYRIKDAPGQPRFRRRRVDVVDQFTGLDGLNAKRGDCSQASFLCVRAAKQVVP